MTPLISIRDLRKSFGALRATDGVSLDIAEGELHAVIGPNGAGQDITALDMAGRVRLGLARSFQITSILPGFTVLENVALAVQARSGSSFRFFRATAAERDLNDAATARLAQVGLDHRAHDTARNLSHGEHRQLEFAIALATEPRMLLLDEPFAGTGREDGARLLALLRSLKGRVTILLIEHDMHAVFALADRVSVMVYGRIIATGPPDEVRRNPEVQAAYLGEETA